MKRIYLILLKKEEEEKDNWVLRGMKKQEIKLAWLDLNEWMYTLR